MLGLRLVIACLFGGAITALALSAGKSEAAHPVLKAGQAVTRRHTLTLTNEASIDYRLTHHTPSLSLNQLKTAAGDRDHGRYADGWGHPLLYAVPSSRSSTAM